jgi:hypothetical protein
MKRTLLLAGFLILLNVFSCTKENNEKPEILPYFKAVKDSVSWVANRRSAYLYTKNMKFLVNTSIMDTITGNGEGLQLRFSLSDALTGNINNFYAEWDLVQGWDMLMDHYYIDTLATNYITISAIDTIARKISGTFSIHLNRAYHKPGTMLFTDGKFGFVYTTFNENLSIPVIH